MHFIVAVCPIAIIRIYRRRSMVLGSRKHNWTAAMLSPCRHVATWLQNRYGRQIWTNLFSDQSSDTMQMKHNYDRNRIILKK